MGRLDPRPKDKYKTEVIIRPRCEDLIKPTYNTAPGDKNLSRRLQDGKRDYDSPQFEYIKRNLCVKSCLCNGEQVFRFQVKKVTIRNYTPKILNQEINMGMWM